MATATRNILATAIFAFVLALPAAALADELTQRIQKDLVALGYDPGTISGEMTTETTVAIAKFQADRNMPVTGEVSPLLAGILSSEVGKQRAGTAPAAQAAAPAAAAPAATQDPAALQAAQQQCLQEKMAAAQAAQKKKRGFGRLMSAVTRTATQSGDYAVAQTANDIYSANATAEDLSAAAKDLGLTEDEVAACQNPQNP